MRRTGASVPSFIFIGSTAEIGFTVPDPGTLKNMSKIGIRKSKLIVPGNILATLPNVKIVEGLRDRSQ